MDWTQVLTILGTNAAIFFWARSESRADTRMMLGMIDSIHTEMKEFHSRLERQDCEFKSFLMRKNKGK